MKHQHYGECPNWTTGGCGCSQDIFIDPGEEYDGWAEKEKAEELLREIAQMTDNAGIQRKIKEYFEATRRSFGDKQP